MGDKVVSTKRALKAGFWYTVSNFLTRAMVFITIPFFTRILTKEQYGDFSVYASWQVMLLSIFGLEVYATINKARFDYTGKGELDSYISSSLVLSTLITCFLFVLYLIFPSVFDRVFLVKREYMVIMFAYLLTYPSFAMFQAKQRIEYKYKLSSTLSFMLVIGSTLLAMVLASVMNDDRLLGRIIGQYGLYIIVGFALFWFFFKNGKPRVSCWKYTLRIGIPMVFSYLGSYLMQNSDVLVLKHMCTAGEVAYLSISHSVSHITLLLVQAVNAAWAPWYYDLLKNGEEGKIRNIFRIYLWAMVAFTFCVLLIGPEIVWVLGGKNEYSEAIYLLPPVLLGGTFTVLTAQFGSLETYYKKPEYSAIFTSIAAVLNVFLNIIGVKLWGYRAVCYTTVLCQIILVMMHYSFTGRMNIRKQLPLNELIGVVFAMMMIIPINLIIYKNTAVRYLVIAVIAAVIAAIAVVKRKKIAALLKTMRKEETP